MTYDSLGKTLRVFGWISIIVGIILAIILFVEASDSWSSKNTLTILGLVVGLLFIIIGITNIGVGQLLSLHGERKLAVYSEYQAHESIQKSGTDTTTTCPKCGQVYEGDLSGKFCEECGSSLDSLSEDDVSESSSDSENVSTTCVMCGKVYPSDLSGKNCPNCNAPL